jgi:hypothetical protein
MLAQDWDFPLGDVVAGVSDTVWTCCESQDTRIYSGEKPLYVALVSGGFTPSAVLVDRIEIVSLK